MIRVRLVRELTPDLPAGSLGKTDSSLDPGMIIVRWDCGFTIPMYRNEVEEVKEQNSGGLHTSPGKAGVGVVES